MVRSRAVLTICWKKQSLFVAITFNAYTADLFLVSLDGDIEYQLN